MNIQEVIKTHLYEYSLGKPQAIKRKLLLKWINHYDPSAHDLYLEYPYLTDRELRKIVESIPRVLSCNRGYYIAATKEEALEHRDYFRKKALPMMVRGSKIYRDYPEFWPNGQMELGE